MSRLSDTILNMSRDENYSTVERSERIEAAIEAFGHTICDEIAKELMDGNIQIKFVDKADLKFKVCKVLESML